MKFRIFSALLAVGWLSIVVDASAQNATVNTNRSNVKQGVAGAGGGKGPKKQAINGDIIIDDHSTDIKRKRKGEPQKSR